MRLNYTYNNSQYKCVVTFDTGVPVFGAVELVEPGIGDVIATATSAVGVTPCNKCKQRQAAMNAATPKGVKRLLASVQCAWKCLTLRA